MADDVCPRRAVAMVAESGRGRAAGLGACGQAAGLGGLGPCGDAAAGMSICGACSAVGSGAAAAGTAAATDEDMSMPGALC